VRCARQPSRKPFFTLLTFPALDAALFVPEEKNITCAQSSELRS